MGIAMAWLVRLGSDHGCAAMAAIDDGEEHAVAGLLSDEKDEMGWGIGRVILGARYDAVALVGGSPESKNNTKTTYPDFGKTPGCVAFFGQTKWN